MKAAPLRNVYAGELLKNKVRLLSLERRSSGDVVLSEHALEAANGDLIIQVLKKTLFPFREFGNVVQKKEVAYLFHENV